MDIREEASRRGITRLCHFTPSRNLVHIASGVDGVLATRHLREDERALFTPTDLLRLDGHVDYICCSIEYPNAWYFERARRNGLAPEDWVVLLINPRYLWTPGTRFCPRNAAAHHGRDVVEGSEGFAALYASQVTGAYDRTYVRQAAHVQAVPTDEQAEVLVSDRIVPDDILGIAVQSEDQARREQARFRLLSVPQEQFRLLVAPAMFEPREMSQLVRSGRRPVETLWRPS